MSDNAAARSRGTSYWQCFPYRMPKGMRSDKQLSIRKVKITSSVDGESVRAWVIAPKVSEEQLPAILFLHGGGFVFKAAPYHYDLAKSYALCANAVVNRKMWSYYLQENHETSLLDFSPPQSFPATYLETAEFDCLRDEGDLFAEMLRASAVQVQYTSHTPLPCHTHGFVSATAQ